jgi:predicted transcriptional regulator
MSSRVTIDISGATYGRLKELAEWADVPVEVALEQAVKQFHDRQFWVAVDAGYAALRADAAAWAEVEAERKLWDKTLMDGLEEDARRQV